jgi:hypothetical protein
MTKSRIKAEITVRAMKTSGELIAAQRRCGGAMGRLSK